uniref:Hcy-binding domain-containing protein n=1 Tax=Spongospora subterranea TaxID=70186 RepID=A0A0H5RRM0_9EUKA|eukprot:CRZ11364.1 hypothetical protein [Spongospora subterranea]
MTKIRVLDGGMSRELTRLGCELRQPEWSAAALIDSPDIVRKVHENFITAGADIVTTNSYALVPFHIGEDRFQSKGASLIDLSGKLARQAVDNVDTRRQVLVAGSLPPIFGSYEPERFEPFRVQDFLSVLVDNLAPHVDLWLGETLSLIAEADAVRHAVQKYDKPFWISFTLADDQVALADNVPRLRSGETVADATAWATGSGAAAILFNCSRPEVMTKAVKVAARVVRDNASAIDIGVYANAFEGDQDGKAANETLHGIRKDMDADRYCEFVREWADAGATLIGGCCGIGDKHIAQIVAIKNGLQL